MKKIITSVILLTMMSLILLACAGETDTDGPAPMPDPPTPTHVAGTWMLLGEIAYVFNADGTGTYNRGDSPVEIRWSVISTILRICHTPNECPTGYCNDPYEWTFSLTNENREMTITSRDTPGLAFTFSRRPA